MSVIVIAEKASVENQIKKVFPEYHVTSVSGHIYQLVFKKYDKSSWLKTKLEDILDDSLMYIKSKSATKSFSNLKQVKDLKPTKIILACDPDEQGALIESHILDYIAPKNAEIYKVKLESLSTEGIKKAFSNMESYSDVGALSGELRGKLDLRFGAILSRLISLNTYYKSKRWTTFNTGRVQTPTLNFLVKRMNDQKNFISKQYYQVELMESQYLPKHLIPHQFEDPIKDTNLEIKHLKVEPEVILPKKGFSTDKLLITLAKEHAVFKKLGTPVTSLLSSMYLKGYITYPRTDTDSYDNYQDLLEEIGVLYEKQHNVKPVFPTLQKQTKVTDHSPIVPLITSSQTQDPLELKVLKTLYDGLKKTLSGSNQYNRYFFSTLINNQKLNFSILKPTSRNFDDGLAYVENLPLVIPSSFNVNIQVLSKSSKPLPPYTHATLLTQMKKQGVGTKSTRTTIIENLVKNEFITVVKNTLCPTEKGMYLSKFWKLNWPAINSAELTKEIEELFPLKDKEQLLEYQNRYLKQLKGLLEQVPLK